MDFINRYYNALSNTIDYESLAPRINVKYRDELCFKGKKVSYEDFYHMINRKGTFIPKILCENIKKSDVDLNIMPYLCIGVAEMFGLISDKGGTAIRTFGQSLLDSEIFFSIEEAATFVREFPYYDVKENEHGIASVLTARSNFVNSAFLDVKQLACMLYITAINNPKLFAEAVIQSMLFSYSFIDRFISPDTELVGFSVEKNKATTVVKSDIFELGAVKYKVPNGKNVKISDDRGIGILMFANLMYHIVDRFGEPLKSDYMRIVKSDSFDIINEKLNNCIGDDFSGKYLKGILRGLKKSNATPTCAKRGFINSNKIIYDIDGEDVEKDFYEENILVSLAYGVDVKSFASTVLDTHYFGIENVTSAVGIIIANQDTLRIFNVDDYRKDMLAMMDERIDGLQATIDKSAIEAFVNKALEEQQEEFKKEAEEYEKQIRELQMEVDLKADKCRQLSAEITSLNAELNSYYSDEDIEELVDSTISISEMIEFLKDYHLVMVGGRNDLVNSLESIGLTSITQIDNERGVSGVQADFICLNTKFLSHKLTSLARERYKHQLDTMYYYNGTNIESLIKVTYTFIKQYIEKN